MEHNSKHGVAKAHCLVASAVGRARWRACTTGRACLFSHLFGSVCVFRMRVCVCVCVRVCPGPALVGGSGVGAGVGGTFTSLLVAVYVSADGEEHPI